MMNCCNDSERGKPKSSDGNINLCHLSTTNLTLTGLRVKVSFLTLTGLRVKVSLGEIT